MTKTEYHKEWSRKNRDKVRAYWKRRYKKYRSKQLARSRKWRLKNPDKPRFYRFGILKEEYERKLQEQNEVCAICKKPSSTMQNGRLQSLSVDHKHGTKQIRGLLCSKCNSALGLFFEDTSILLSAVAYLAKWTKLLQDAESKENE